MQTTTIRKALISALIATYLAGCDSQNRFHLAGLDSEWSAAGISAGQAQYWIEAGFSPQQANNWSRHGFTAADAVGWRDILRNPEAADQPVHPWDTAKDDRPVYAQRWIEAGFSLKDVGSWVALVGYDGAFQARDWRAARFLPDQDTQAWIEALGRDNTRAATELRSSGIPISEVKDDIRAGIAASDTTGIEDLHEFRRRGTGVQKAVAYHIKGIRPDDAADYEKQEKDKEARRKAVFAPCHTVRAETQLLVLSPYAIEGVCFRTSPLSIVQWIDRDTVIAVSPYFQRYLKTPFYVETKNLQTSMVPSAIVIGETPYTYSSTSGAEITAFHLKVLAWETELP